LTFQNNIGNVPPNLPLLFYIIILIFINKYQQEEIRSY